MDQPRDATLDFLNPRGKMLVDLRSTSVTLQAALILALDPLRILQERTHILPHGLFQQIGADLFVVANAFAAKPVSIASDAAVVGVVAPFALAPFHAYP